MGQEIDLLINYPKTKRDLDSRLENKSEDDRKIARQFGKDFLMVIESMDTVVFHICQDFGGCSSNLY